MKQKATPESRTLVTVCTCRHKRNAKRARQLLCFTVDVANFISRFFALKELQLFVTRCLSWGILKIWRQFTIAYTRETVLKKLVSLVYIFTKLRNNGNSARLTMMAHVFATETAIDRLRRPVWLRRCCHDASYTFKAGSEI